MKRIKLFFGMLFMLLLFSAPMSVSADMGPKPIVSIEFIGLEEEEYYVTLLSEKRYSHLHSTESSDYEDEKELAVFEKFLQYEDIDGYYFLKYMEDCSETDVFGWDYMPPNKFKILIYLPQYDRFIASEEIYETYAFDSYYTVRVSGADATVLKAEQSYDYLKEIFCLLIRIIMTIAVESCIALLFYSSSKRAMSVIFTFNVITQIILNVLLNIIDYKSGGFAFLVFYVQMEFIVFMIEAVAFRMLLGRRNPETGKRNHPFIYAALANFISFQVGYFGSFLSEIL